MKNGKYDIIISIVLYNTEFSELKSCINCILNSNLDEYKYKIVILDNSNMFSDEIKKYCNQLDQIAYHHSGENLYYGGGHNYNMRQYIDQTKYFLIMNNDISFNSNVIPNLINKMEKDIDIGLSSVKILNEDGTIQYVHRKFITLGSFVRRILYGKFYFFRELLQNQINNDEMRFCYNDKEQNYFQAQMISGCFMMFRSGILKKLGGFDEKFTMYCEDLDLSKRANNITKNIIFTDLSVVHKWERGSGKSFRLLKFHILSILRYFWYCFSGRYKK